MKRRKNQSNRVIRIVFILIGLLFIVNGVLGVIDKIALRNSGFETIATIIEFKSQSSNFGKTMTRTSVIVEYRVDEMVYINSLPLRLRNAYVGEEVRINYNPDNPSRITPVDRNRATEQQINWLFL